MNFNPPHCTNHSRYRGVRKPKVDCLRCWKIWLAANSHPLDKMKGSDLIRIIDLLERDIELTAGALNHAAQTAAAALYVANHH